MNNLSQPPQPTEPDMALVYLGSLFETVDCACPPERDEAKLQRRAARKYFRPANHARSRPSSQLSLISLAFLSRGRG